MVTGKLLGDKLGDSEGEYVNPAAVGADVGGEDGLDTGGLAVDPVPGSMFAI